MSQSPIKRLKPYFKTRPRAGAQPANAPGALPAGFEMRREQLARRYAELQSDLGGLVYEMAIRDHFRLDVVVRRAAELQAVDAELTTVEQQLGLASPTPAACPSCGAPVQPGAQYCGRCGSTLARSASGSTPVSAKVAAPSTSGSVQ